MIYEKVATLGLSHDFLNLVNFTLFIFYFFFHFYRNFPPKKEPDIIQYNI